MKKVVAVGSFDGVHAGHLHYLHAAKKLGTYLIVLVSRDKLGKLTTEGYGLNEQERKNLVEQLHIANKVLLGSETDVFARIRQLKPDIIAITSFHPVDAVVLRSDLKRNNISA